MQPSSPLTPIRKKRSIALILSVLVPGLGQLYKGERAKGVSLLCITLGIWFWMVMATVGPTSFRSWVTLLVLGVSYLLIWFPAVSDVAQQGSGMAQSLIAGKTLWYVILMVLATGAMAVPLLWQSPRFSRRAKLAWSAVGILNTLLALLLLAVVGPRVEGLLEQSHQLLRELR